MKPIVILTFLLTLSACGGGFFWFDMPETKPATAETTNVINPANENITKMTSFVDGSTDLTDVEFEKNANSKTTYTFTLDGDGRIDTIVRNSDGDPMENYIRQGNENEFIGDEKGYHYTFKTYGNGNLQYSDFGYVSDITGGSVDLQNTDLVAGGYNSKMIDVTPTALENQLFNGTNPVFKGNAIAKITKYEYHTPHGAIISTDDAEMRFSSSGYELSMPFHTKSSGGPDYYDVVVVNNNIAHPELVQVNFQGGYDGEYKFADDTGGGFSKASVNNTLFYGDNGNVSEIVGSVRVNDVGDYDSYSYTHGCYKVFESAYGVKKQ